jgi:hypothetical protein
MIQPAHATINGMVDAMIAAKEASTVCIATKFKPRYSAFWQTPKTATDIHCFLLSRQLCPNISAMITPIKPEIKNRAESE